MKKRILIVDDDEMIRGLLTSTLVRMGFEIDVAADGMEALCVVERRRYDLIITDFHMPAMNGADLARAVKKRDPSCPIVAITGCHDASDLIAAGVDRTIRKPFALEDIALAVQGELAGRRAGPAGHPPPTRSSRDDGSTASPPGRS